VKKKQLKIHWPNKIITNAYDGDDWFFWAEKANLKIPTGCLNGSCGACEIDVNGETIRPCVHTVESNGSSYLNVEFIYDPFW